MDFKRSKIKIESKRQREVTEVLEEKVDVSAKILSVLYYGRGNRKLNAAQY